VSPELPSPLQMQRRTGRKWRRYGPDVLPAWIADMDFLPAPAIGEAVMEAVATGDFGYGPTTAASGVPEAFARWARRRWGWDVDPAWVQLMPDVVGGLANCVEALTEPGDGVLVQTPIYPPFLATVAAAGRRLVAHPLVDGRIDLQDLDRTLRARPATLLLLCNPHNPTGRCFTVDELQGLLEIAETHGLTVVADEVHADLVYAGHRHIPFASLSPQAARRTVTLNSASKAFNTAGLRTAVWVASDPGLRARLLALPSTRWNAFSTIGVRATLAAWSDEGEEWLHGCVGHLQRMRGLIGERLACAPVKAAWTPPEAGYLAWLDFRGSGLGDDPASWLLDKARVALSPGPEFGAPGQGFARLNFATSQDVLGQILSRIEQALLSDRVEASR
jgi:cysteine-S-conjugate beta-lyase